MQRIKTLTSVTVLVTAGISGSLAAQEWSKPDMYVATMIDSAYVSEGRDNLDDGGLASYEIGADFGSGVSAGIWTADDTSDVVDYEETNFFVEYGFEAGTLDAYVGATHLSFNDGSSDNELGFGLATTTLPATFGFDYVRSAEADGFFVELSVSNDYEMTNGLNLTPYAIYALDYGYASEVNDGHNHTQLGVDASMEIAEGIEVFGYVATSLAGDDVEQDGGDDETWGGVGVSFSF